MILIPRIDPLIHDTSTNIVLYLVKHHITSQGGCRSCSAPGADYVQAAPRPVREVNDRNHSVVASAYESGIDSFLPCGHTRLLQKSFVSMPRAELSRSDFCKTMKN